MAIKHKMTTALVALFLIAFGAAVFVQKTDFRFASYRRFEQIKLGMAEAEVVRLLGPPDRIQIIKDQYDLSYKANGYTFRALKSGGTVYIYQRKKDVCYVLLNEGRVTDVSIGYK